jgi:hypothetical protein
LWPDAHIDHKYPSNRRSIRTCHTDGMAQKSAGKKSKFLPGDEVILRGRVTLSRDDDFHREVVTVAIHGYGHAPITLPAEDVAKAPEQP